MSTPRSEEDQIRALVDGSIAALRSHPRVGRGVPIVVALEGCSVDPIYMANMLLRHDDVLVMTEIGAGKRYGVPKDERITRAMVTTMQTVLSLRLVVIPTDAIAFSTPFAVKKKTMRDFRECLATQFGAFCLNRMTGKLSGKGSGGNDDLVLTFMMVFYWMTRFAASINEDYVAFKQQYGDEIWQYAQAGAMLANARDNDGARNAEVKRATKRRKVSAA